MKLYRYIIILIIAIFLEVESKAIEKNEGSLEHTTHNCPFTRIIEDIFKINKTTNLSKKDEERTKLFLDSVDGFDRNNPNINKTDEELINTIIASIKRIKDNITSESSDSILNEAIILNKNISTTNITNPKIGHIKSGLQEKFDINNDKTKNNDTTLNPINDKEENYANKTNYVEILTIEPNNTIANNKTSHILDALKYIMPMFNNTGAKDLQSITIIEKKQDKNQSITESKNISTIIMKYCDKDNTTKKEDSHLIDNLKPFVNESNYDDYLDVDYDDKDVPVSGNLSKTTKDVLEAAEYGMQKMHELYGVLEPKLYYMGLWLDEKDPARYVAAFNAPSEDIIRYSRYGYASLQAAAKLKELTSYANADGLESRVEGTQFPAAAVFRQSQLLDECPLRGPPKCPPASKRYRTHDGTCNNLNRPRWGSTMTPVQRFIPPVYSDGIQAPRRSVFGSILPSAREISALVHEGKNVENFGITHLLMQWGQFIDHDITSSSQSRGFNGSVPRCCVDGGKDFVPKEFMHPECFPIAIPPTDPFYGPRGVRCLDFVRSSPAPRDDCALGWREQFNQVSAYIDGSPIYASSARQSDKLRLFRNGMLLYGRVAARRPVSQADQKDEMCRGGALSTDCFRSGDARVNEQPGLVAAHIVWLRMHNRMAQELTQINPHWSDEKTYQETRKIVGAMIQHITYREFLPIVLGPDVMRLFELELQKKGYHRGYNPKINASPASSFGSAAFRFGHSLVQPTYIRFDRFHRPLQNNVSLHDEPANPSNIWSVGAVDRLIFGMINQPIQKRDEYITEELTNHLFQTPFFDFGMDLASINVQRGRDHGVPPYTAWREPCGLSAITDFEDLFRVMSAQTAKKLRTLYRHVDDIDLFTGGMSERPVVGGLVGPTFACIIAQQFSNLRKGDRFWYENGGFESSFTPAQLQQIRQISLAQVLCRTLDSIDSIQPFVFLSADNPDNSRISCLQSILNDFDLSPWTEINSDSNNVRKASAGESIDESRPNRLKQTTKHTTAKPVKFTSTPKLTNKRPISTDTNKAQKFGDELSFTDFKENKNQSASNTELNQTVHKIDDKLDFQNKTLRFNEYDTDRYHTTKRYNDYDDDVQSVQSVVINNLPHKRPYRPYLSVTENVEKYTYLINYVPRPTQSWRQTTKRNYDRDVVKVTYQNYDDTYRRPNRPYYNRGDLDNDFESRHADTKTDVTDNFEGRSNDGSKLDQTTIPTVNRNNDKVTKDQRLNITDKIDELNATTENLYKLMTFGYVGTYKGDASNNNKNDKATTKQDTVSKDFWTVESKNSNDDINPDKTNDKISTFFLYDTATKPYNPLRPTRHDDVTTDSHDKYYYEDNVLRKYPNNVDKNSNTNDENAKRDNPQSHNNESIEERSVPEKIQAELPPKVTGNQQQTKKKKPSNQAKTPSVAFQIIPSENSPTQWAVYEENEDLPETLPYLMPVVSDPYALREVPRPMRFKTLRRPSRS